jgi:hypothetical protein
VDDLVVDDELTALVRENENAHASASVVERASETIEQLTLVKDGEGLLDITSFGHGNDAAVITDVEDAILLEDGPQHVLHDDRWGRVADEGRLFVQHLGEQVNTKVTMLAGLAAGGDADDLAWSTLENQKVANADVVARDGDGVGAHLGGGRWVDGLWRRDAGAGNGNISFRNYDFLTDGILAVTVVWFVVVMMMMAEGGSVNGMCNSLCNTLNTTAEAVVMAVVVVVAHVPLVFWRVDGTGGSSLCDTNFALGTGKIRDGTSEARSLFGVALLTNAEALFSSCSTDGAGTLSVLTFSYVESRVESSGSDTNAANRVEVAVVGSITDVELGVDVLLIWFLITLSCHLDTTGNALARNTFAFDKAGFLTDLTALRTLFFSAVLFTGLTTPRTLFFGAVLLVNASLLAVDAVLSREAGFVTFPSDAQSLVR